MYGAGAIGSVIGARLHAAGHNVTLIARGAHLDAIRAKGLSVASPDGTVTVPIDAVGHPRETPIDSLVLLTMKTQDTAAAVRDLWDSVSPKVAVACVQNGVENERIALRSFPNVYGVTVMCPTVFLEPGVVQANSSPMPGVLDVGRYPSGADDLAEQIAAAFRSGGFMSEVRPDIARWKYSKLLMNLGNAIEAVCGPPARRGRTGELARAEGVAVLRAAGIDFVEDDDPRREFITLRPIDGQRRPGGSSWQSLQRGTGTIETDYLNGEIVLLGRLHGLPTPANEALQRLARQFSVERRPPGSITEAEILALIAG